MDVPVVGFGGEKGSVELDGEGLNFVRRFLARDQKTWACVQAREVVGKWVERGG